MNRDFQGSYLFQGNESSLEGNASQLSTSANRDSQVTTNNMSQSLAMNSQYSSQGTVLMSQPFSQGSQSSRPASQAQYSHGSNSSIRLSSLPHISLISELSSQPTTISQYGSQLQRPASLPPLVCGANYAMVEPTPEKFDSFCRPTNPRNYLPKSSAHVRSLLQAKSGGSQPTNKANNGLLFGDMSSADLFSTLLKSRESQTADQITRVRNDLQEFHEHLAAINNSIAALVKNFANLSKLEESIQAIPEKNTAAIQSSLNDLKSKIETVASSVDQMKDYKKEMETMLVKVSAETQQYFDSKFAAFSDEFKRSLDSGTAKVEEMIRNEVKAKIEALFQLTKEEIGSTITAVVKQSATQSNDVSEAVRRMSSKVEQMAQSFDDLRHEMKAEQRNKQITSFPPSNDIYAPSYTVCHLKAPVDVDCNCRSGQRRQRQRVCECNSFAIDKREYCVANKALVYKRARKELPKLQYVDYRRVPPCRCHSVFDSDEEFNDSMETMDDRSEVSDDWF